MTISIDRYVSITSVVGGATAVRQRELIGRIYTDSVYANPTTSKEFTSAKSVAEWFGGESIEARIALAYFGFVTKSATRPSKMSFAAWRPAGADAIIIGGRIDATWDVIKDQLVAAAGDTGKVTFSITIGGGRVDVDSGTIAGYTSFSNLAGGMQEALRAVSGDYAQAVVSFSSNAFMFLLPGILQPVAGDTRTIGNNPSTIIQLLSSQTKMASAGTPERPPAQILSDDAHADDNFATFSILPDMTEDDIASIGDFMGSQNEKYLWCLRGRTVQEAKSYAEKLMSYSGIGVTLSPLPEEFPELLPMFLSAASNYNRRAANRNYEFYQMSGVTPSVNDDTTADDLDNARVNYYGQTQTSGNKLSFYQKGRLTGLSTDAIDMNVYVNEIWLKDLALSRLMSQFMALEVVPANRTGAGYVTSVIQSVVDEAKNNGVIIPGKTLNITQKMFIQEQTGDELAYLQVQNDGAWLDANVVQDGDDYVVEYLLIYSKGDAIRKVVGSHIMI